MGVTKLKAVIEKHYKMTRSITDYELVDEIVMLKRHNEQGTLWNNLMPYYGDMERAGAFT